MALPILNDLAESDWFDQFAGDYSESEPPPFEGLDVPLRDFIAVGDDGKELPWLECLIEAALDLYESGAYEAEKPMKSTLVLSEAMRLDPPRPDLVERAIVAQAEQRLHGLMAGDLEGEVDPRLVQLASAGGDLVGQRAAECLLLTCVQLGRLDGAVNALMCIREARFSAEDLTWLLPVVAHLEEEPAAARELYTRWMADEAPTLVRAFAKARRATVLLRTQIGGSGHNLIKDYGQASTVLSRDPDVPREVVDQLDLDFAMAKTLHEEAR